MRIALIAWTPHSQFLSFSATGVVVLLLVGGILGEIRGGNGEKALKRHAIDDDELHDEEIFRAVVQSLNDWQQKKKLKQVNNNNSTAHHHHRVKRDEEIVCYGELGCFRDEGPFDYLDMLPSPPEEVATKFLLFTRQNRQSPQVYSYFNFTSMYSSNFNSTHPTKVIIHGFGSTCNRQWATEMRLALLSVEECNVICVDWENGAAMPNYVRAAVNTRLVGKQVALLIFWLNEHLGSRTHDYHLVGFSLGAHIAGFSGQELKTLNNSLSRITALDAAGPLFEGYDKKVRLDSEDALFVDVIHSNGDSLLMGGLGSWEPMGQVDFYPNGGRVQKGCSNLFLGAVRDFLWSASDGDGRSLCNHRRAYKFFTESISPRCPFPAFACESYDKFLQGNCFNFDPNHCGNMGYYADRLPNPKKGLLFLITREEEPFCANQFRITIESSPSPAVQVTTYGGLEAILIGHDFINETFLVTQTAKDNMVAGSVLQRIIVAHPAITEPVQVQLKYTAYQGWLYSGISRWSMERLIVTNAYGQSMSFCSRGLLLPSGIPVTVTLTPGICLNRFNAATATNSIAAGSRPVYVNYPYETYPTQSSDSNAIHGGQIGTENNTISPTLQPLASSLPTTDITDNSHSFPPSSHTQKPAASADIELSMKPPPPVLNGQGHEEIGPSYHHQATGLDWSQWQPLPSNPTIVPSGGHHEQHLNTNFLGGYNNHHQHHHLLPPGDGLPKGTPVETYPAVGEDDLEPPKSTETSPTDNVTIDLPNQNNDKDVNLTASSGVVEPSGAAATTISSALHQEDQSSLNLTQEIQSRYNTSVSTSEHVKIRICHMVDGNPHNESEDAFMGDMNDFGGDGRKLSCIDPSDVNLAGPIPSTVATAAAIVGGESGQGTTEFGSNLNATPHDTNQNDHQVNRPLPHDRENLNSFLSSGGGAANVTPPLEIEHINLSPLSGGIVNESTIPVPPESFWAAIQHNNTIAVPMTATHVNPMNQYQGADPDVVLPPHLQYILQQLDSQGLGPKSVASSSHNHHNNYNNHGYRHLHHSGNKLNRGLVPSSRALKPRPVVLSSRRQAKAMDIGNNQVNHGGLNNVNNLGGGGPPGKMMIGPMMSTHMNLPHNNNNNGHNHGGGGHPPGHGFAQHHHHPGPPHPPPHSGPHPPHPGPHPPHHLQPQQMPLQQSPPPNRSPAQQQQQQQQSQPSGVQNILVAAPQLLHSESSNQRSYSRRLPHPPPPPMMGGVNYGNRVGNGGMSLPGPVPIAHQPIPPPPPQQLQQQQQQQLQLTKNNVHNNNNILKNGGHVHHGQPPPQQQQQQPMANAKTPAYVTKQHKGYYIVPYYANANGMIPLRRILGSSNRRLQPGPTKLVTQHATLSTSSSSSSASSSSSLLSSPPGQVQAPNDNNNNPSILHNSNNGRNNNNNNNVLLNINSHVPPTNANNNNHNIINQPINNENIVLSPSLAPPGQIGPKMITNNNNNNVNGNNNYFDEFRTSLPNSPPRP